MKKFKYRKKKGFWKSQKDATWLMCNEKQVDQLKTTAPRMFEFEEVKEPKPTESMEKVAKKAKKEPKIDK